MMMNFGQPMLPRGILRELVELWATTPAYDAEHGGQWSSVHMERIPFQGCVLPVSDDDWRKADQGTFTKSSRKVYTNGHALRIGSQVCDPLDGAIYTVTGDLDHGVVHPMRRFVVERKGAAAPK